MTGDHTATSDADSRSPVVAATVSGRDRGMLATLMVTAFMVVLNETVTVVAIPHVMSDLGITTTQAQWLTTSYLLTMAVVIPTTGYVLQRVHTRTVFATAVAVFAVGSLTCAVAPVFGILLTGRVLQACGAAIMVPLLTTTVLVTVEERRRGTVFGVVSVVIAVAPAAGPVLAGAVLSVLDWRWLFWIMIPIAAVALLAGVLSVRDARPASDARFDLPSFLVGAAGFGALIAGASALGESEASMPGWVGAVLIAGGGVLVAVFIVRQRQLSRRDRPYLDLRTFRYRGFTVASVGLALTMAALFGALIMLPIFAQHVMHLSALTTGLMLLPGGAAMGVLAPPFGALVDRIGARPVAVAGAAVMAGALACMTTLESTTPVIIVIVLHSVFAVGMAAVITPLLTAGLGALPERLYTHGSATLNSLQQLAGALGTAAFVAIATVASHATAAPATEPTVAGYHAAFVFGAGLCGAAACCLLALPPRADRARTAPHLH